MDFTVLLAAFGFALGAMFTDFLKWRTDSRGRKLANLRELLETVDGMVHAILDAVRTHFRNESNSREHEPYLKIHTLVSLYLPSSGVASSNLLKAMLEYHKALKEAKVMLNDTDEGASKRIQDHLSPHTDRLSKELQTIRDDAVKEYTRQEKWLPFKWSPF